MSHILSFLNKVLSRRRAETALTDNVEEPVALSENNDKTVKVETNPDEPSRIDAVSADEIMRWQNELIGRITGFLGLSRPITEKYFLPVVRNYVEYVHLLPASENHHHSGVGGLVIHGLETCLFAVKLAENSLPYTGSEPSLKKKYETKWRLAVAIAALIHDVAKVATDMTVTNEEGLDWLPFSCSLTKWLTEKRVSHYYITYRLNRGKKHEDYAITIARVLIPQETMSFMESGNAAGIIYKLFAALNVSHADADPSMYDIRDLVIKADSLSVEKDIADNDKTDTISNGLPLDGYFLSVVRKLLMENLWSVNFSESQMFYSSESYMGAECLYINWSHGAFDSFYEMIAKMPEIHGVPKNIKKLASYLSERGFCAGSDLHFRIMLKPGFTQGDIDVLSARLKENLTLPMTERLSVKELLKELEIRYLEIFPFTRADLIFGAVLPLPETLYFVEESEVVCEQAGGCTSPGLEEEFSKGLDLLFGDEKPEKQQSPSDVSEPKKMSADDITLSLFENLQEGEETSESAEVLTSFSGSENEPEKTEQADEITEKKTEESESEIIHIDANGKKGTAGIHRTRIKHVETDIDILTGKKKPPKHFVPNRQEYMATFYASSTMPEKSKNAVDDVLNQHVKVLRKDEITTSLFADVIAGKRSLSPDIFISESDKFGIRPSAVEFVCNLSSDLTRENLADVLVKRGITVKDRMNNYLSKIGSEEGLLLSQDICNSLFMLNVNVAPEEQDKSEEMVSVLETPEAVSMEEEKEDSETTSPAGSVIEPDAVEIEEEETEDDSVPENISGAMERIFETLISQLLKKHKNPAYESMLFHKDNTVTKVTDGQFMCDVSAADLCERINMKLASWNYEIDALTLTRFLAGHSASMTRQFFAVTGVKEDFRD